MAGVAAQRAVERSDGDLSVDIRWPNDLLVNGEKSCLATLRK